MEEVNTNVLLPEMRERALERKAGRALKHVKRGRYALFVIVLQVIIPSIFRSLNTGRWVLPHSFIDILSPIFFIVTFVISRYKPFAGILAAIVGYIMLNGYIFWSTWNNKSDYLLFEISPAMFGEIVFIAVVIRLTILFFLVNGAVYSRKLPRLELSL